MSDPAASPELFHGTTILLVARDGRTVIGGDGQVTLGQTVMKASARKVRRLAGGKVIAGFAGATADAFALFERLEAKLEQHPDQLQRACVELAKDWRTDRYLRRLEAMMAVADASHALAYPERHRRRPGARGRPHRHRLRRRLSRSGRRPRAKRYQTGLDAEAIVRRKSMAIAAGICIYTNANLTLESLPDSS